MGMAQHFLHGAEFRPVLQKMGGEAMAQGMGGDRDFDSRFFGVLFDLQEEVIPADALAP